MLVENNEVKSDGGEKINFFKQRGCVLTLWGYVKDHEIVSREEVMQSDLYEGETFHTF